jgi:hypothetical protein
MPDAIPDNEQPLRAWCRITVASHKEFDSLRGELLSFALSDPVRQVLTRDVAVFSCGLLTDGFYQVYFSPRARIVFHPLLEGRRTISCPASRHATPTAEFIIGDTTVFDPA